MLFARHCRRVYRNPLKPQIRYARYFAKLLRLQRNIAETQLFDWVFRRAFNKKGAGKRRWLSQAAADMTDTDILNPRQASITRDA